MSITLVKPYFNSRCKAVGLKQHPDAFNEGDIPNTTIDNTFHVLITQFNGLKMNQSDQEINCGVSVHFWINGKRDPDAAIDRAVQKGELLLKETLKNSNRLGQCLKNVVFLSMSVEPFSKNDDNIIKVTMTFNALTSLLIS